MTAGAVGILGTLRILVDADTMKAQKAIQAMGGRAQMAGAAIGAGLGVAAIGAMKMGYEYANAMDDIRVATGATGDELAGLEGDFKSLVARTPYDLRQVATVMGDLNTRLEMSGQPLQDLTEQFMQLGRITRTDATVAVGAITRMFGDWSVAADEQSAAMDKLFRASQMTGIGYQQLAEQVVQFGAPLRNLGMTFEQSLAMLGKWEKEGVNTILALGGMKQALGKMAQAGVDVEEGIWDLFDSIENASTGIEAMSIGVKWFGKRAGPDMVAAIREGRFAFDDLTAAVASGTETITQASKDTEGLEEVWKTFKNTITTIIGPGIMQELGDIGQSMGNMVFLLPAMFGAAGKGVVKLWQKVAGSSAVKNAVTAAGAAMGKLLALSMTAGQQVVGILQAGWGKLGTLAGGRFGLMFKFAAIAAIALLWAEVWHQFQAFQNKVGAAQADLQSKVAAISLKPPEQVLTDWQAFSDKMGSLGGWEKFVANTWGNEQMLDGLVEFGRSFLKQTDLTAEELSQGMGLMQAAIKHAQDRGDREVEATFEAMADSLRMRVPVSAAEEGTGELFDTLQRGFDKLQAGAWMAASILPDIAGDIRKEFQVATAEVAKGFGAIKDAIANPPQMISKSDRLENMHKRLRIIMRNMRKSVKAEDPWLPQYWENARAKQQAAIDKLKGKHTTSLKDIKTAYRKTGADVSGKWRRVQVDTVHSAETGADGVVDAAAGALAGIDALDGQSSGYNYGAEIAGGMANSVPLVQAQADAIAQAAADSLESESPPRKGPLSTIDKWGKPLIDSWLSGIEAQQGRVAGVGAKLAGALAPHPTMGKLALAGAGGTYGGGRGVTYQIGTLIADDKGLDALDKRIARRRRMRDRGPMRYSDRDD